MIFPLFGNALPADVATFSPDQSGWVDSMAWSPDGTHFAAAIEEYDASTGGNRMVVQVWEVASGHLVTTFSGSPSNITALAWSGNGREIVSGSANQQQQGTPGVPAAALIQVWNATNGQTVATYREHPGDEVDGLSWASDGHAIVSSDLQVHDSGGAFNDPYVSETRRIKVWEVATGKNIATVPTGGLYAMDLVWLPNGKVAAVLYNPQSGSTGTVSVRSVSASGQLGRSPCTDQFPFTQVDETYNPSHTHLHFYVQHAQLSPDGKRLAVDWGAGRTIDVWRVGCVSSE